MGRDLIWLLWPQKLHPTNRSDAAEGAENVHGPGNLKVYISNPTECVLSARGDENGFSNRLRRAVADLTEFEAVPSADEGDMVIISECWRMRDWRHLDLLGSCPFIQRHAQKLLVISHKDVAVTYLPGIYVSLTGQNHWRNWSAPCGYKQQYSEMCGAEESILAASGPSDVKKVLFSFRGADFTHPVRRRLSQLYSGSSENYRYVVVNKKFGSHDSADRESYLRDISGSHFVLAPRGWSPSSYRLYEAMQYGRCPVIISDDWQAPEGIDWDACSIRISEDSIGNLVDVLGSRLNEAESLGLAARKVWLENFADEVREQKMLRSLLSIHNRCARPRDLASLRQLWRSSGFQKAQGWSAKKKLKTGLVDIRDKLRQRLNGD